MRHHRLTITMLSPVHVGTGQVLAPTQYVVRRLEADGETYYVMLVVDMTRFLSGLDRRRRAEFDKAVRARGLDRLVQFVAANLRSDDPVLYQCWTGDHLFEAYRREQQAARPAVAVFPLPRSHLDHRPILPGSAVKGAIRLAVVSHLAGQSSDPARLEQIDPRDFQAEVLGYQVPTAHGWRRMLTADPFRALGVADAALPADGVSVDPVVLFKPGSKAEPGIDHYYEMTFSRLDDETIETTTDLTIDQRLAETPTPRHPPRWPFDRCVTQVLSAEQILQSCRAFYVPKLQQECRRFFSSDPRAQVARKLLSNRIADNEAIIRLGRFSHFESVTVDKFRRPPRRGAGATRSLASGTYPMGWAKIRIE